MRNKRMLAVLALAGCLWITTAAATFAMDCSLVGIGNEGSETASVPQEVQGQEIKSFEENDTSGNAVSSEQVRRLLSVMTKEEKAGQMLMVSPSQLADGGDWVSNIDQVLQNIRLYHIGSLIFFEEDLQNEAAVKELTGQLASWEEGIRVMAAADPSGSLTGGLTKAGTDAVLSVGPLSIASDGELWCYGTTGSAGPELSSLGILVDLSAGSGVDFAVTTHALAESGDLSGNSRPASMTRTLVQDTLKGVFDGIVMTDSLSMPEAVQPYGAEMAVQYALLAGNDLLTAPANVMNAYYGMLSAVDEQLVAGEQINASVEKILLEKQKLGLLN